MYNGNEKMKVHGEETDILITDFWKWGFSNLLQNMMRGTFAEFVVKSALDRGGIIENPDAGTGLEPYDLNGPIIKSTNKKARIEAKSAAKVQLWEIKHPERLTFSIAPASLPDQKGDYRPDATKQRNNDIYVFSVYLATDKEQNILDMDLWEFYVVPTCDIENHKTIRTQKIISLKAVKEFTNAVSYSELCNEIQRACNRIPKEYKKFIIAANGEVLS